MICVGLLRKNAYRARAQQHLRSGSHTGVSGVGMHVLLINVFKQLQTWSTFVMVTVVTTVHVAGTNQYKNSLADHHPLTVISTTSIQHGTAAVLLGADMQVPACSQSSCNNADRLTGLSAARRDVLHLKDWIRLNDEVTNAVLSC